MLNAVLYPYIRPALKEAAKLSYKAGLAPNYLLYAMLGLSLICFLLLGIGLYGLALLAFLGAAFIRSTVPVLLEARANRRAKRAAEKQDDEALERADDPAFYSFIDHFLKFLLFAGFIFFFMVSPEGNAVTGGFLLLGFALNIATQQYYKNIRDEFDSQDDNDVFGPVAHISALAEGAETIIVFTLMCLLPIAFPFFAVIYGFMSFASAVGRVLEVRYLALHREEHKDMD